VRYGITPPPTPSPLRGRGLLCTLCDWEKLYNSSYL